MKITKYFLSIPPYISTSWDKIDFLRIENNKLIIVFKNAEKIEIPNLDKATLELVFKAHSNYLEDKATQKKENSTIGFPMKIGLSNIEGITSAMQHNPNQTDGPELPEEILNKIVAIAKILGQVDSEEISKPEPHCNCLHCQISRALQKGLNKNNEDEENSDEEVSDEDLKFKTWDIKQVGKKLYLVTNPLNKEEKYSVYLGVPIGCTCGKDRCEHIQAVLNS